MINKKNTTPERGARGPGRYKITPPVPTTKRMNMDAPESDLYTTSAILAPGSDSLSVVPVGIEGVGRNKLYATLVVNDVRATGNDVRNPVMILPVEVPQGTLAGGVAPGTRFTVTAPSYTVFKGAVSEMLTGGRTNLDRIVAIPMTEDPVMTNEALPTPVKVRDALGSLMDNPSATCQAFKTDMQELMQRMYGAGMGTIADRNDIRIFQGSKSGRSPGFLVHQPDGKLYMFDSTGKGYITIDGGRTSVKGAAFDLGSAQEERNHKQQGFPIVMNPVLDTVPNGTIITPQPFVLPNFTRIAALVLTICDMVDLVKTCVVAVNVILGLKDESAVLTEASKSSFGDMGENRYWDRDDSLASLRYEDADVGFEGEEEDPVEVMDRIINNERATITNLENERAVLHKQLTQIQQSSIFGIKKPSQEEINIKTKISEKDRLITEAQSRLSAYLEEYGGE